jgi:HAMP domain-containing protein/DNA-directed RNA polymerase subunit RPC12/RpoP
MDRNRMTEDDQAAPRNGGAGMAPAERQVIVICEECGKKYSVVPSRIRGAAAGFTCSRCGHRIVVAKPPEAPPGRTAPPAAPARESAAPPRPHRKGPGMRAEMVGIVLVFPLLVMAGAVIIFLQQVESLASDLGRQWSRAAGQRVEERVTGASTAASGEEQVGPASPIQDGIATFTREAGMTAALILGGAFLTAVIVVLLFGLRLAVRIRTLADAAARISSGDLAAEVETGSRDELGILAEAVARLRENLRLSQERMSR